MIKTIDIFFLLFALGIFFWGVNQRLRLWRLGSAEKRSGSTGRRLKALLIDGIAHRSLLRELYPGSIHLGLFLGFMIPLFLMVVMQVMFTVPQPVAAILSLLLDIVGLAAALALLLALHRRIITRPSRLTNRADDLIVLLLLLSILTTGFLMEGLRLSIIGKDARALAPIGYFFASLWDMTGIAISTKGVLAAVVFRIHFFLVLGTITYIPFSKLFHIISSPLNIWNRSFETAGALKHLDLEDEEAESFGVTQIQEFSWKHLMDLDGCTQCGRCQDYCPAYITDKPLSPKKLISDLKDHLHQRGPQLLRHKRENDDSPEPAPLIENVITEDVLWACTTCRSCMEHCPVFVEHVDKVIDMRRYQVLMEGKFPDELTAAFRGLENNSNPWGLGFDTRADWAKGLDVPVMAELEGKEIDYLLFVGCLRSFDDRNKRVSLAMVKILKHLGVNFAILGIEEGCCGDPARRVGNEYLYQVLAQTNIENFQRYGVKRILTTCPHCFNTLKNEYPQMGFTCEVIHHTTFLHESISSGRLKLQGGADAKLTYHDPCYLGRYNQIYDAPRQVLQSIGNVDIREMKRSRSDSLCCGAGGGWMWMDEKIGKRINLERLDDALATETEGIATACPFCVTMLSDAVKDKERESDIKVWDLAELVADAIAE